MSNTANHIIQKQTVEVTFSSKHDAAVLQEKIKAVYYEKVLPKLDHLFSEVVKDDIIIRLDRVDLDLGHLREDDLEKQLIEKMITAITNELQSRLQFDVRDSNNISLVSPRQSIINAFFYFLKNGYFPWWCSINDLSVLESEIITNYTVDKDLAGELMRLINTSHHSLLRLNFQFSEPFKYFLVEKVCPSIEMKNELAHSLSLDYDRANDLILKKTSGAGIVTGESINKKAGTDIDKTINTDTSKNLQKIREPESKDVLQQNKIPLQPASSSNDNKIAQSAQQGETNENLERDHVLNENRPLNDLKKERVFNVKKNDNGAQYEIPGVNISNNISQKPKESVPKQIKENNFDGESIYMDLAGLVILHPFIVQIFSAFKLTIENRFINEGAIHSGVHLLGYIATGETMLQEQVLLFPKLLCGVEFGESIKKEIVINAEQEKEITELLSAIISHWGALKNTSPDGLRNMFLKRAGKLSPCNSGWQLDVEQKTWDILLGKLPWGISIVKLPWMKQILFVNWQ